MAAKREARPAKISTAPLFLFLGLVALLGVILGLVGRINKKKIEEAEVAKAQQAVEEQEKAEVNPFDDLPDEVAMGGGARGGRWAEALPRNPNPEGIEAEAIWQSTLDLADIAWVLSDQALKAWVAGDGVLYDSKGREARVAFQKALDGSEDWLERMIDEHGDRDPAVREVIRTRDRWTSQISELKRPMRK